MWRGFRGRLRYDTTGGDYIGTRPVPGRTSLAGWATVHCDGTSWWSGREDPSIGSDCKVKIHKIGNESFSIFDSSREGEKMMVQFIWGKKDFRIYLQPAGGTPPANESFPIVRSAAGDEVQVTGFQYLNNYEWCNYDAVAGHGLANEEVRWPGEDRVEGHSEQAEVVLADRVEGDPEQAEVVLA